MRFPGDIYLRFGVGGLARVITWLAYSLSNPLVGRAPRRLAGADLAKLPDGQPAYIRLPFCCGSNPLVGFKSWGLHGIKNTHGFNRGYLLFWRAQKDSNPQPSDP